MPDTYRQRELARSVRGALATMPVVVITGMRQVGKTTMLQRELSADRRYLSLDEFPVMAAAREAPGALLGDGDRLTLDEIQRAPDLLREIKAEVDRSRRPGRFLLSGSANLLLMRQVAESLAGRAVYLDLWPMTRRERCAFSGEPMIISLLQGGRLPRAMPDLTGPVEDGEALAGGMPPIVVDRADPAYWFRGFVQTYLERDIRSLSQVADLVSFQTFLRLLAMRTGQVLNVSQVARDARLSVATATRYLNLLETSFSVFRVPPYLGNRTSRLVKSSKIYLADAGLADHLIGPRGARGGPADPYVGALLETYVAHNLRAILAAWLPGASLCFWNVQGRYEVDFVIEAGQAVLALEVKRGSRWSPRDLTGLRKFLERTPQCLAGLLACQIASSVPLGDRLWAVPLEWVIA